MRHIDSTETLNRIDKLFRPLTIVTLSRISQSGNALDWGSRTWTDTKIGCGWLAGVVCFRNDIFVWEALVVAVSRHSRKLSGSE